MYPPLYRKFCFVIASLIALFFAEYAKAQGNLLIIPRRVVFNDAKRTQELNLANTGKDTARYIISVIQYRMKEDGNFEEIAKPDSGQYFADKNFRFFPRNVTLAPNETQVIKLQLTNSGQLKPGEYRSHLYFRAVPEAPPLGTKDTTAKKTNEISIKLTAVFGIAIPVIIRSGTSTTAVTLSDLAVKTAEDNKPVLSMKINRAGNMSVYGDIKVNYVSAKGVITQVAAINGLSVYTPNTYRKVQLYLDNKLITNYHTGKLQILFGAQADAKPAKYAEGELVLN